MRAAPFYLVIACLAAALAVGMYTPLYTDEVGSKVQLSRVFAEGGRMVWLLPQCKSAFVQGVPFTWYPGAALYALLLGHAGLFGIKLAGVGAAVLWLAVGYALLSPFGGDRATRAARFGVFVAAHGFGVAPLLLVMSRAEGVLLSCLAIYTALAVRGAFESRRSTAGRAGIVAAFVLVTSVFYFSHSKALLYTPFVLLAAALTFPRKRPLWLAVPLLFAVTIAGQTFAQASRTSQCPEAPRVDGAFAAIALKPSLARADPARFVRTGVTNVLGRGVDVAEGMAFVSEYPAGWLPAVDERDARAPVVRAANRVAYSSLYALELAAVAFALVAPLIARRGRDRRAALLGGAMLVCLVGHVFFMSHWAFYNSPFPLGQLALLATMGASVVVPWARARFSLPVAAVWAGRAAVAAFVLASTLNLAALLTRLAPTVVRAASREGTALPGQAASVPPLHYARERVKIRAHAARCGIRGDGATHLVVDDATFYAFDDLTRPLHLIYVSDATMWGLDMPGAKNVAFLRSMSTPGIISRCTFFPTALAARALRSDDYCCVGRDALEADAP